MTLNLPIRDLRPLKPFRPPLYYLFRSYIVPKAGPPHPQHPSWMQPPTPDTALAFDRQLYGLSGTASLWPTGRGKGLESAVREQQGALTRSGVPSVLGLLGRGTHASSSREIRKLPFLPAPRYLYQHGGAPRTARPWRQGACAKLGVIRGDSGRLIDGRAPPPPFPPRRGGGSSRRDFPSVQRWRPRRCCHLGAEPSAALESRCHRPQPARLRGFVAAPRVTAVPPLRVPGASPVPPPSAPASCLGPLVRPSSRHGMPRGSVGRWG